MKKLRYLLLAASLAAGLSNALVARAQAPPPGLPPPLPDTARFYQNELGLTASPRLASFFTANRSLPVGLIYKRHFSPKHALRVRVTGLYSRQIDSTSTAGLIPGNGNRLWETMAYLGYERRAQIAPRWQGYYGLEAGTGVSRYRWTYKYESIDNIERYLAEGTGNRNRWLIQGRAFAGFSFRLTKHLVVFTETAFTGQYYRQRYRYDLTGTHYYTTGLEGVEYGIAERTSKRTAAVWRPIQLIGLSTSF